MDKWLKTGNLKKSASRTEIRTTDLAAMEITVYQQDDNHEVQRSTDRLFRHPPLHLQLQSEARYVTLTRLQKELPTSIVNLHPNQIESKASGWASHPSHFLQTYQISLEDGGAESLTNTNSIQIFTDGSKSMKELVQLSVYIITTYFNMNRKASFQE
ncbi:hypothetical protein AVEN_250829-1 [Araneus ventricosus]|uniref:Uncharacterized protein n=1 Tax=Araneus ventricosus TaxID=182803 RepID=A0A4Y2UU95_ARAVE|nr:hypothetical protein AVEN_250829-1 [Araneus ventricosus]